MSLHDPLLWIIVGLWGAALVNQWRGTLELQRFGDRVTAIATEADLDAFKAVVARQMHAALLQMALLGLAGILAVGGLATETLGPEDLGWVVLPGLLVAAFGALGKRTERRIQRLPAPDPAMAARRDEVVRTWLRKAVPDW